MNAMLLDCCNCAAQFAELASRLETPTNCEDVEIAKAICCAIVSITAIIVLGSLLWRLMDHLFKRCQEKRKQEYDVENSKRKQESDLKDKLLDFLKSKASEKNNNKGQQAIKESLSLTPQKIYDLLKGNAHESDSSELRKQYIELCVDILQNLKAENKDFVKPKDNEFSKDHKNYDSTYIDVLCTLIGICHKKELSDDNIKDSKQCCALKTDNDNPNPENVKHEEKESKKS